jgi:RNA polymerase sigma-70 factor (ECF subfamily)
LSTRCSIDPVVSTPNPTDSSPVVDQARWFTEEVQAHDSSLKGFLRRSFPSVRDVDDVVQESYLRIWKARAVHPIASAKAFLFQIARRLAVDSVRRERHDFVADVREIAEQRVSLLQPAVAEAATALERARLLADAIEDLPARCREIFVMRKLQDFSQRETAMRLGLSERTVEVQVARAMKRCAGYLRRRGVTGFDDAT